MCSVESTSRHSQKTCAPGALRTPVQASAVLGEVALYSFAQGGTEAQVRKGQITKPMVLGRDGECIPCSSHSRVWMGHHGK